MVSNGYARPEAFALLQEWGGDMKNTVITAACAVLCSAGAPAYAATVVLTSSPQVASSVTGVLIDGTSYDVTFDGTETSYVPAGAAAPAAGINYSSAINQILQAFNSSTAAFIAFNGGTINQFAIRSGNTTTATTLTSYSQAGNWQNYGSLFSDLPTARFTAAVPEPATWAMMLVGFGMVAGVARYRRRNGRIVYA